MCLKRLYNFPPALSSKYLKFFQQFKGISDKYWKCDKTQLVIMAQRGNSVDTTSVEINFAAG